MEPAEKNRINDNSDEFVRNFGDKGAAVAQKGREVASDIYQGAQRVGTAVEKKTDNAISSVGEGMTNLANSIRENTPTTGAVNSAAATVADSLEAGGQYLTQHGIGDMAENVTTLVRKYPVSSVCIGVGLGVLVGSALARR